MYDIEVRDSGIEGKGVFATRDFAVGEKIYEYQPGRRIKRSEVSFLTQEEQEHLDVFDPDYYELMTPPASYVNHSCDPNMIEKERVGYALKPIKKGEELTADYRVRSYDDWQMQCHCGSANCTGTVIGNFFSMPIELQKKYLSYAPEFIQKEFKEKRGS